MTECDISKIIIDDNSPEQIIVLKEKGGDRFLPIVIGLTEASAIKVVFANEILPRPITHDLLKLFADVMNATVKEVFVRDFHAGIFYATIVLTDAQGGEKAIDARPSDAIALAVRAHCPIFVKDDLLERTAQE
jgi:bifunctional DNase/RNase